MVFTSFHWENVVFLPKTVQRKHSIILSETTDNLYFNWKFVIFKSLKSA